MDIEEAIYVLKKLEEIYGSLNPFKDDKDYDRAVAIKTVLNELDKKDKIINEIKWKPISEYNRKKYDWVLVKYFDGDYECVPNVAERRSDGKWYTDEGQIPFEVKYFFDMQILDYFTKKCNGGRNE